MDEIIKTLNNDGVLTIPRLHSRLVESKARLARQPFYVALSGDSSTGTVQLCRWENAQKLSVAKSQIASRRSLGQTTSLYLRLWTFHPINVSGRDVLVNWMTKDSPSSIEDIEVVDKTFAKARNINSLGLELDQQGKALRNLFLFLSN